MATKKPEEAKNPEVQETIDLAAMQAQMAAMLAEAKAAKAEAEKLLAEAKAIAEDRNGMNEEELAAHKAYMNEEVEVKLFKDNGKYKDDVPVGCNGELIVIKRGERVKIKRKYAEILDNSEHQDYETSCLIEQKSKEFEAATKALG